jgi:MFS family permease
MRSSNLSTHKQSRNPVGYVQLIRGNTNFRNLWFGQIISLLGDWFNLIASAALIGRLTQSGVAVGGLFVIRMLAPFIVSPLAGVVADRYNRKTILIIADITRALTVLGFLFIRQPGQVWFLYVLTAVQLGISGFFFPARSAILPDVVTTQELGAANALGSATWSIMLALGSALGGIVAGSWGIYPAFVIDAATFLLSAFFVARVIYQPTINDTGVSRSVRAALIDYVDGLRYLKDSTGILVVALLKAAISLGATGAFQVIQVRLTEQIYVIGEGGSTSLGIMYAIVGIGTGLGPIWARKFTGDRERPMRIAIVVAFVVTAIGLAITAPLPSFGIVLVGTFLRGFGGGLTWVFSTQLLLMLLPNRVRGRVFSTEFAIQTLMAALAAYVGGWGLDHPGIGISGMLWVMSGMTLFFGLLWMLWLVLNSRPDHVPEAG